MEIRSIKVLKTILLAPSNCVITYYQTLGGDYMILRQEKLKKKDKCFLKKLNKITNFFAKFLKFES